MPFARGNTYSRFAGKKHRLESNKKRSETIKRLYSEGKLMGNKNQYPNEVARKQAKYAAHLKIRYGIEYETYEALYEKQAGVCAICGLSGKKLVVDHDHLTNNVRGLLCQGCNILLGAAKDSPSLLCEATIYLAEHASDSCYADETLNRRLMHIEENHVSE